MKGIQEAIQKNYGDLSCEYVCVQGFAVDEIARIAQNKGVDLICMGSQGTSGLERVLLGSVTAKVIEKADCPVLAIPRDSKFKEIKKIAFSTDYHNSDLHSIRTLAETAKKN